MTEANRKDTLKNMCNTTLEDIEERIKNIKTLEELEELEAAGIIEGIIYKDNFTPFNSRYNNNY